MRRIALAVTLCVMLAGPASATEDSKVRLEYMQLWNDCQAVWLVVEGLHDDAAKIGLRRQDIITTIRSRLRGARIFREGQDFQRSMLYANVNIAERAFNLSLGFRRIVKVQFPTVPPNDLASFTIYAVLWNTASTGTHGGKPGYILSSVAKHTDEFVDEYLRVNKAACERR